MLPCRQARARVMAAVAPLPGEQIGSAEGLGRVLAEDVRARVNHPPVAVSAMDGYAGRSPDTAAPPVTLRLIGEAPEHHPAGPDRERRGKPRGLSRKEEVKRNDNDNDD